MNGGLSRPSVWHRYQNGKKLPIKRKEENKGGNKEKCAQNRNTDGAGRTTGVAETKITMNKPGEMDPLLA